VVLRLIQNPVTRKRYLRFKSMKRAYWSFWILLMLYGFSLGAELVSNSVPLYIRYEGRSYFPVFRYYPEDVFTGSGRQTRPDYKYLARMPIFQEHGKNYMIFPFFTHGPTDIMRPQDLPVAAEVRVLLIPEQRTGTVDIRPDFSIVRSHLFDFFTGGTATADKGESLTDYFELPEEVRDGLARRFSNQPADRAQFVIENHFGQRHQVFLFTFTPRDDPPETVRLMFRETGDTEQKRREVVFDPYLRIIVPEVDFWAKLSDDEVAMIRNLVAQRFDRPVEDERIIVEDRQYQVSFIKEDVRFPFAPVKGHPMGIDSAGRDVLARVLYGLRISLTFGLLLAGGAMVIGIAAGAVQGYRGGLFDITSQRVIEVWSALPFLYVMILMGSIYGRSFALLLFCYGIFNWIGISYYVRAEFLSLRKRAFVEAAKCMGIPSYKIIFRHILPNALVPVITFFPFSLVGAIGALAALDYLGFGLPPPTPSWGELLFQAQEYRWAWWLILYPSLALFGVMLLGVFVGEGVRNAYDPKQFARYE
jgi:microcin C transport system permease protein